jgi:Uncharacterized protein conserved in bacteria
MKHSAKVNNKIYYGELLALYGNLLTKKQFEYMQSYFQEDYSLAEIAENYNVTRVAIHNQLQNACKKLDAFENELHLLYLNQKFLPNIEAALINEKTADITKEINKLRTVMKWSE